MKFPLLISLSLLFILLLSLGFVSAVNSMDDSSNLKLGDGYISDDSKDLLLSQEDSDLDDSFDDSDLEDSDDDLDESDDDLDDSFDDFDLEDSDDDWEDSDDFDLEDSDDDWEDSDDDWEDSDDDWEDSDEDSSPVFDHQSYGYLVPSSSHMIYKSVKYLTSAAPNLWAYNAAVRSSNNDSSSSNQLNNQSKENNQDISSSNSSIIDDSNEEKSGSDLSNNIKVNSKTGNPLLILIISLLSLLFVPKIINN